MKAAEVFRWVLTAVLILIFAILLVALIGTWSNYPVGSDGKANGPDLYSRAKETIGLVIPLVTLALGYWFGVKGADSAKEDAANARQEAANARSSAVTSQKKVEALFAEATPDIVATLERKYPNLFAAESQLPPQNSATKG